MGLFSKSKKTKEEKTENQVPWHILSDISQLEEIKELSMSRPVAIFKHSTRCGISRMVLRQFESTYSLKDEQLKLYYLDLLTYRNISDEIGFTFQVLHQSPQLIVVKNGVAVAHAAHHGIQADALEKHI
ncbi:MAG: bacillithiol system protein YtxJ [Planctomycetota bacterium]|jgi:bacillithiol system protein YtxJ|uniref:bacillithiol system redox-active protein YtxJ n=1 Tax=Patiriisocius sp. Uisw_047 TaxID=3230969 RepID=UPI0039EA5327